jgi:hypothetical protein
MVGKDRRRRWRSIGGRYDGFEEVMKAGNARTVETDRDLVVEAFATNRRGKS